MSAEYALHIFIHNIYDMNEYRRTKTTVYCCRYHVVFCPKYRRKLLTPEIAARFKEIASELQKPNNFHIIEMEVMPNCVHMLLDVDPTIGVDRVIARIKGRTAHELTQEFPEIRRKVPTLWTRGKFIATVGSVSFDTIKKYIEEQKNK